ncbi:MAG: hypothetical protein AAF657_07250, partial [Acidobacteriota bacterium]
MPSPQVKDEAARRHRTRLVRLAAGATPWLLALAALVWLTAEWWGGFGEHSVEANQATPLAGSVFQLSIPAIDTLGWLDAGGIRFELLEEGQPLDPQVDDPSLVGLDDGDGSYYLAPTARGPLSSHHSHKQSLTFSASDGGDVRSNGRDYVLRWSRRSDPNAALVVLVSWLTLLGCAIQRWKRDGQKPSPVAAGSSWRLGLPILGFTLFALFGAHVNTPPPWPWFFGLTVCCLPALSRWRRTGQSAAGWPWLVALAALALATSVGDPLTASRQTLGYLAAGVAAGFLGLAALRGQAPNGEGRRRA